MSIMTLEKAAQICADVAKERIRWGRHAGRAGHRESDVLDALRVAHEEGLFDNAGEKVARVKANRQKAAAEARATKAQNQVKELQEKIEKLEAQLADSKEKKSFFGKS